VDDRTTRSFSKPGPLIDRGQARCRRPRRHWRPPQQRVAMPRTAVFPRDATVPFPACLKASASACSGRPYNVYRIQAVRGWAGHR
jgi:hypothetical protein